MRRPRGEALFFAIFFALVYVALAVTLFTQAPYMYHRLDQVLDADLSVWAISLSRPGARLQHYMVHPLITLFVLPWGIALREALRWLGVRMAGRLAVALLCALAGGATVGAFRLLLERLGVRSSRARAFTVAFALSATQIVFSSLPESHAFSALSLVLVFLVAAPPVRSAAVRLAAGVFSFGVTATGLVAVALTHLDWRQEGRRAPLVAARAAGLVVLAAAALALVQQAAFPGARPFFIPGPLGEGYTSAIALPTSTAQVAERTAMVGAHMVFVGMAAPRVDEASTQRGTLIFEGSPVPSPRPAGAAHGVLWGGLVAMALWGLRRGGGEASAIRIALMSWLAFVGVVYLFFGASLFLFSGQWVFAVVALTAAGLEALALGKTGDRVVCAVVVVSVALQTVANASLVGEVIRTFSRP